MVPYDVLVDPLSLPTHPTLDEKQNMMDVVHADSTCDSDDPDVTTPYGHPLGHYNHPLGPYSHTQGPYSYPLGPYNPPPTYALSYTLTS